MNGFSGSVIVTGSLRPSLPPSSWATSTILTCAPAQGWSERSSVVSPSPMPPLAPGSARSALGAATSEGPSIGMPSIIGSENKTSAFDTP